MRPSRHICESSLGQGVLAHWVTGAYVLPKLLALLFSGGFGLHASDPCPTAHHGVMLGRMDLLNSSTGLAPRGI